MKKSELVAIIETVVKECLADKKNLKEAEKNDPIYDMKIKNPVNGHMIKVRTALSYRDNHPAKRLALAALKRAYNTSISGQ